MTRLGQLAWLGLACCAASSASAQQTIYVNGTTGNDGWTGLCETWDGGTCGPKKTIQAGIDAAADGDTVLIADGTYTGTGNKNLDYYGKLITVRSANGPETCIIDCETSGQGFCFHSGEGPEAVLEGVTITNGYAAEGAGVYCWCSSPTIRGNRIDGNAAGYGGGIYCESSSVSIVDNIVAGNTADTQGAGICCCSGSPMIDRCTILDNHCAYSGGGVFCLASEAAIVHCTVSQNSAGSDGGGISFCWDSHPMVVNGVFAENSAGEGGAIFCMDSHPIVRDSLFFGNSATGYSGGGAVQCRSGNPNITNCTFTCNSAFARAGGIGFKYPASTQDTVTSCVLWNDSPVEIYAESGDPLVTFSDVQGGWAGEGNIDVDPMFVDPDNGDYHLAASSACIDAGDPNFVPQPGEADIDGQMRVWDGNGDGVARVDMGSDEFGAYVFGDLNCDGAVDFGDINPFVLALSNPAGYAAMYPGCDILLADVNRDGLVDFGDINPFVELMAH
jgi:hypothetical protein